MKALEGRVSSDEPPYLYWTLLPGDSLLEVGDSSPPVPGLAGEEDLYRRISDLKALVDDSSDLLDNRFEAVEYLAILGQALILYAQLAKRANYL
jgi:hypothetical protein